jgi:MFS transporter, SHS family, lactate transporter
MEKDQNPLGELEEHCYWRLSCATNSESIKNVILEIILGVLSGAILCFGTFSERIGRRRAICIAALLTLPIMPLWAFSSSPFWLAVGAFVMQFLVQGAWGVIPVHLNELSPPDARGTFPGFTYQLGNLFAAANATIQAGLAEGWGGNYAQAMAIVVVIVAIAVFSITVFGPEAKGVVFAKRAVTA